MLYMLSTYMLYMLSTYQVYVVYIYLRCVFTNLDIAKAPGNQNNLTTATDNSLYDGMYCNCCIGVARIPLLPTCGLCSYSLVDANSRSGFAESQF